VVLSLSFRRFYSYRWSHIFFFFFFSSLSTAGLSASRFARRPFLSSPPLLPPLPQIRHIAPFSLILRKWRKPFLFLRRTASFLSFPSEQRSPLRTNAKRVKPNSLSSREETQSPPPFPRSKDGAEKLFTPLSSFSPSITVTPLPSSLEDFEHRHPQRSSKPPFFFLSHHGKTVSPLYSFLLGFRFPGTHVAWPKYASDLPLLQTGEVIRFVFFPICTLNTRTFPSPPLSLSPEDMTGNGFLFFKIGSSAFSRKKSGFANPLFLLNHPNLTSANPRSSSVSRNHFFSFSPLRLGRTPTPRPCGYPPCQHWDTTAALFFSHGALVISLSSHPLFSQTIKVPSSSPVSGNMGYLPFDEEYDF